ncbi:thiamine pyrophosphate-dependent enzyme [Streptomyces sp. Tu 3180]|uniref:thiamine pyrophosphate-dependent enzyme n=1 Tax=Streptomyces sp. Tu 3180 TaxID=2682611 RepID=UPI001359E48C|nr:thiamine pyrophosphate-dependent enzyme [Streptomyces sp. Tu 3180]KAF3468920.1 pyruvate dehydrogenase (acetyl-transferring) E1 component subunit alpha [Streptomyces sp. Tu 3180]
MGSGTAASAPSAPGTATAPAPSAPVAAADGPGAGGGPAVWRPGADGPLRDPAPLLPDPAPVRVLGTPAADAVDPGWARTLHQRLVVGRRFNEQATALARQGRLAVYPSSTGQEACQVAAVAALRETDWLFPTYRDTLAVFLRGHTAGETLALLHGAAHSGYDPRARRTAPLCTPLATHLPHAVGLAHAARLRGDDVVALALAGDGATSEGDFHEALTFAGVLRAPVVFLVQNNGFAISVPLARQNAAPTLAHKAVGYGLRGRLVEGNDVLATYRVVAEAVAHARAGRGPVLVEAITYRIDPHTNADDPRRYRADEEVALWREHDPVTLMEAHLGAAGLLDDATVREAAQAADRVAAEQRAAFADPPPPSARQLFGHVYARPTPHLREQAAELAAWRRSFAAGTEEET